MKTNNLFVRNASLVVNTDVENIEGETLDFAIVFDIDNERMFYLNSSSYEIYQVAEKPIALSAIIEHFTRIYMLNQDDIESIKQTVLDMTDKNILFCMD